MKKAVIKILKRVIEWLDPDYIDVQGLFQDFKKKHPAGTEVVVSVMIGSHHKHNEDGTVSDGYSLFTHEPLRVLSHDSCKKFKEYIR